MTGRKNMDTARIPAGEPRGSRWLMFSGAVFESRKPVSPHQAIQRFGGEVAPRRIRPSDLLSSRRAGVDDLDLPPAHPRWARAGLNPDHLKARPGSAFHTREDLRVVCVSIERAQHPVRPVGPGSFSQKTMDRAPRGVLAEREA